MHYITHKSTVALILLPLFFLMGLAAACGLIDVENPATATPLPPAAASVTFPTSTSAPTATSVPTASPVPTATPNVPLPVVPAGTVELSVLIEPLDVGYVEVVGSLRLSNGQATEVHRNDQINLIARPTDPEQWRFDRWGGDLQGTFASDALVMDSSKKIRAIFVRVDARTQDPLAFYGVTLNGQPIRNLMIGVDNGSVEVSPAPGPGESPFREGTIVSLTPRPNERYELGDWGLDCGGGSSCVLTMNDDKEVTVSFKIIRHSLTVAAQPAAGGSVSPTGATEHNYGDRVTVTAQPSAGYEFTGFSGACSGTGSCSVLMDSNQNVTAKFKEIDKFSLQTAVNPLAGGSVSPSGLNEYPDGQKVSVTFTTATGYTFSGWTGNCSGSGACSVTMNDNRRVTVNFTKDPVEYLLTTTVSPSGGGTVSPTGTNTYAQGASVTITATPASGYEFIDWSGDCSGSGSCSVTMNEHAAVTANFKLIPPPPPPVLTTTAGTGGTVSPSGSNTYALGSVVVVTQAANSGYTFSSWSGHCTGSGTCSVTMSADRNVTATFDLIPDVIYDLTTIANPVAGGSVSPSGTTSYPEGTSVTVTANFNAGYEFSSWSGACSGAGACVPIMNENKTVTANFIVIPTPSAGKIVFNSDRDGNLEIYIMDADGSNPVRITNNEFSDSGPTWFEAGGTIAFISDRDGNQNIYVMEADGSNQTALTTDAGNDDNPDWSPNGAKIAWRSNQEIWVMDADGSNKTRLTNNSFNDSDPTWCSNDRIAFDSFRGSWDVFIMNSDGTGETQLTAQSGHQTNTRCSPSVGRIAYHDGTQLVTMDLDGSNKTPITVAAYRNASSWSPDGSQILFNTNRDGNEELYVMDAGGSNQVRLTDSPAFDGNADWAP